MTISKRNQINKLFEKYKDCNKCPNVMHNCKVFGTGNLDADICVIGEGPGKEEVEQSEPFVGPAGQLLNRILNAIDIKREEVYFTNILVCRTTDRNRTPSNTEITNCNKRLLEELSIVKPDVCILAGSPALQTVFGSNYRISREHGQWISTLSKPCYFYFPIYHPSWILHSVTEGEKRSRKYKMWQDIQFFRDTYKTLREVSYKQKEEPNDN